MSITTYRRLQGILVSLLVLCLSPTAVTMPLRDVLHSSGADSRSTLWVTSFSGGASSDLVIRSRSRLVDSLDELLKATFIHRGSLVNFTRKHLPFFFEDSENVVLFITTTIIPVRAPPFSHFG